MKRSQWHGLIRHLVHGPYIKSEYNPISNSGHEVAVWHYNSGISLSSTTDGPEKNTIQWASDSCSTKRFYNNADRYNLPCPTGREIKN